MMDIKEVYKKYEHLDHLLSDPDWLADNFEGVILYDLWQAVKAERGKGNQVDGLRCQCTSQIGYDYCGNCGKPV